MINRFLHGALLLPALVLIFICPQAVAVSQVSFDSHNIRLTIAVPLHKVGVIDSGMVQVHKGWNFFKLGHTAQIELFHEGYWQGPCHLYTRLIRLLS